MQKWIILGVIILIVIIGIVIVTNVDIETEYIPESEIEEVELRKTIVSLYFIEKETGEITKETRLIDSKELLKNPYEKLINMLLEGPQGGNLEKILPENVSILETKYENGTITVNFSQEFLELENRSIIAQAIEKTLTELTEVVNIKVLVEGKEIEESAETANVEAENTVMSNNETENIITSNATTENVTNTQNAAITE